LKLRQIRLEGDVDRRRTLFLWCACVPALGAALLAWGGPTQIVDVYWDPELHAIHVLLDSWPGVWDGWKAYLNGQEIPMEGGPGRPVIRPDAPLSQPPTGLLIGTLPWVSGLDRVDFPCCGTLQFYIPGQGLTNPFQFNLADLGCSTASAVDCPREWEVHVGDLVISTGETRVIEGTKFRQRGHVYVERGATLVIRDSEFMMSRGSVPTVHVYFFVQPGGYLRIENSRILQPPHGGTEAGLICVINQGRVEILDSETAIHYFDMSDGAELLMEQSTMVNPIGGLLQVTGGETHVVDSTIGALGLYVPTRGHLIATDLHSGTFFERWDVHQLIPEAEYELVLERTTLLKDDLTGEYRHGPYERGWIFFLDPDAHVQLSRSELRKVFLEVRGGAAEFHDLRVGVPTDLRYRDILLEDVVVMGQWPLTIEDAEVTIYDSNYLFLQPSGHAVVRLIRSHMVEFIPRDFFGVMEFQDARWTEAGEIIGGVPYHSGANRFTMRGTVTIEGLRENLQLKSAQVTREFPVEVVDERGSPVAGALVKVAGQALHTDATGRATFTLVFDETNYNRPVRLEVWREDVLVAVRGIDFFTSTPIRVRLP